MSNKNRITEELHSVRRSFSALGVLLAILAALTIIGGVLLILFG